MEHLLMSPVVMLIIGIVSVARTARLITHDTFPPMEWARPRLAAKMGNWADLMVCPFCIAPYLAAGLTGWWWLAHGNDTALWWWIVPNAIWAGSYLAAILVAYDQPD